MKKLKFETKVTIAAILIPAVVTLLALAPFPQGIKIIGDLVFQERASVATTPLAGTGTFYVKNTTPSTPVFVDDTGAETTLGAGGGGGGDPTYGSNAGASDNAVYVDSANEVGIGTTAPDAPLHIYSSTVAPRIISQYYSTGTGSVNAITGAGSTTGSGLALVSAATQMQADDGTPASANNLDASNQVTQFFVAKSFGLAIPNGATIVGIKFTIEGKYEVGDGGQGYDADVYAIKGNTHQTGYDHSSATQWPTTYSARDYGGAADMWSNTWTEADVESTGFGVAISITLAPSDMFYIDYIRATVYYSTSGDYTWSTATDILDGAWTIRGNGVDLFRMAYAGGAATFTGVVDADGYKQDGVLYDLSTFGAGGGDVDGPASSTDYAVALFNGTTGKILRNSTLVSDASGNLTLGAGDTVDGRELSTDGAKLDGIESGATADQTNAEIETAYNAQVGVVSQAVAEAGTSTTVVRWTPERVKQAIDALATPGSGDVVGPASSTDTEIPTFNGTTGKLLRGSGIFLATTTGNMSGVGTVNGSTIPSSGGNFVMETSSQTVSNKRVTPRDGSTASSATPTINTDAYDIYRLTAQAAAITSFSTNLTGTPAVGQQIRIKIKDDGTARAITWGASFASGPATLPTTTVVNKNLHTLHEWDGSIWRCMAAASDP